MKLNIAKSLFIGIVLAVFSVNLAAEEAQGVGSVECGIFGKKNAFREAVEKAKASAIRNWIQKHPDDYKNFTKVEEEIFASLDRYSVNPPRVQTYRNKDTGTCVAEVVIDLNVLELKRVFLSSSENAQKQGLTFVFVAREKDQVGSRAETTTGTREAVRRDMGRESTENTESQERSEERTSTDITGGSVSNEQVVWRTESIKEVDSTVKQEFIRAGYRVAEQSALISASKKQFNPDMIELGYKDGGDIDASTIDSAIAGLKAIDGQPVTYLATAALDVDLPKRDPKTNLYRVSVTVTGKVFDIHSGGFFTAAACSVLGTGEGDNIMTAKFNALNKAARECAEQMVGLMSGENIR